MEILFHKHDYQATEIRKSSYKTDIRQYLGNNRVTYQIRQNDII
jgi:hypothetical protein